MTLDDLQAAAALVKDAAFDRQAQDQIAGALRTLHGRELVLEVLARCQALEAGLGSEVIRSADLARQVWTEAEAQGRGEYRARGVPTGLHILDHILTFSGWPRAQVSVVAGSTSAGKSALAITCAYGAVCSGQSVLCVSLEDEPIAAICRLLSKVSGIDNRQLQRRIVGPTQWDDLMGAINSVSAAPISFIDRATSAEDLCAKVRAHVLAEKTDLVVLDYLQLIRTGKGRSQQEQIDHVFGEVVHMARSLSNTATLVISQLRRTRGERPTREDLYHSGSLEQWAHTIGILWRPEVKDVAGCVAFLLEKQKQGPTGRITLGWDATTCSFADPEPHTARSYEAAIDALGNNRRAA